MDPTHPSAAAAAVEPEWDSDDFVLPPVGNVSAIPAPSTIPAPIAIPTPTATIEPVEPAATVDAQLEFGRSLFGGLAISAPLTTATITKDVCDSDNNDSCETTPKREPKNADLHHSCKDFIEKQPMYKFARTPSKKSKLFKAFYSACCYDYSVSYSDVAGERRWNNTDAQIARLWADFIRNHGSAKGSVLR